MMGMDIDPRTPHVPLMNTEQLLGGEKTSFHYWPGVLLSKTKPLPVTPIRLPLQSIF